FRIAGQFLERTDMEAGRFDQLFAILDSGSVILCPDRSEWGAWMKKAHSAGNHVFAEDSIEGFQVFTIFLGINFNLGEPGPPLWFETAVFRRSTDGNPGVRINCDA